jgi:nucleoside-diphosphate-sugar epimerase
VALLGATGLLGRAVARRFGRDGAAAGEMVRLPWAEIGRAGRRPEELAAYVAARLDPSVAYDFIIACGLIDPAARPEDLDYSNHLFPRRLIEATSRGTRHRYMTFGTIHENFPEAVAANPYFQSKLRLGAWIGQAAEGEELRSRLLHLRLHTIYGNPPSPIMFLGQLAHALKTGTRFRMSSGEQLREYVHVDDLAAAVRAMVGLSWNFGPVLELNSGNPVRLVDLARAVFRAFGREELLEVGAIGTPTGENRDRVFPRSDRGLLPQVRDPVDGVVEVLREHLRDDPDGPTGRGGNPPR